MEILGIIFVSCEQFLILIDMRRTIPAIMAALVLILSGCSKEDREQATAVIKTYTKELVQSNVVSVRHQLVPAFDAKGRLCSMIIDSEYFSKEGEVTSSSKSTIAYAYDESAHTALEMNLLEGELAFFDGPTVMELSFDNNWKLTSTYFAELESSDTFEYDGDRMIRHTSKGLSHETPFDITWKDGDIVSIVDESATITITYLPDGNPFKKGIDPTLDNLLPDYCTYSMTGAHSAHLPDTYTNAAKTVKTYKYEYERDTEGRITKITIKGGGETSYYVIGIQY